MAEHIIVINSSTNEIKGEDHLSDINIYDQVLDVLRANKDITIYTFKGNKSQYHFELFDIDCNLEYYIIKKVIKNKRKNKHVKVEMKRRNIIRLANDIGYVNAKLLHAKDEYSYSYIKLRDYLKENKINFPSKYLYQKNLNDEYEVLRHKNLFSKYGDQISDVEKLTTISKAEGERIKVSFELDENVFEYDEHNLTIQDRKFMRELAKDIYNKKNLYTSKELTTILSSKDVYIQIVNVTPKEHKSVWDKIEYHDMDIRILQKSKKLYVKDNVPQNKKRKYLSKKQLRRKQRRQNQRLTFSNLKQYYEYY